jgi:membrane-associated phospholipid phosphatase
MALLSRFGRSCLGLPRFGRSCLGLSLLGLLQVSSVARAEPRYAWDSRVDTAVTVAAGSTWAALYLAVEPELGPSPAHGEAPQGLDRVALDRWSPGTAKASDALLYSLLPLSVGASAWAGSGHDQAAVPALLVVESFALTGALVDLTKLAVRRPRPYTWTVNPTADNVEKRTTTDSSLSFPSGHTAFTGAVGFSTAAVLVHSREVEPWAAYGGAGLLTAGMGGLRVLAGRHYPTDVLVGGAIGAAVGISTVSLHESAGQEPAEAGVPRGSTGRQPGMVQLSGVW